MEFSDNSIPKHVAIIMDGNRRWAKKRGLPVNSGHKEGAKVLEKIIEYADKIGIKYITVYAFSTENWKRAEEEVNGLMFILQHYLDNYLEKAEKHNVIIKQLGDIDRLPKKIQKSLTNCIERTKNNSGIVFNIALNYGGRQEILKAVKEIAEDVKNKKMSIEDITEEAFSNKLYTAGQPDPDLLIRTSGELRTSGFLPWQIVYTELSFVDKYWPDFTEEDLDNVIIEYQNRTRRFGAN